MRLGQLPDIAGFVAKQVKVTGTNQWLKSGDSLRVYASYSGVPEDVEKAGVDIPGFGLVPDIPISEG
ncbi:hypothetical protein Psi02_26050 [Planotetraspora silvatica]|uniref:Uncharacterized protein n=1 Tax=Planotetraspora silvatica TaxID=234614 RepID=A0A8J3UKL3_9ACTN|nr:hypothetical protein [Planotetraspora silvatica]GII46181.1 hypothetical protein Psi02_26050 [Planotetraspora silvatica]